VYPHGKIQEPQGAGGDLNGAYRAVNAVYADLDTTSELAPKNAGISFQAMQFE
jgi:hypothetical protein